MIRDSIPDFRIDSEPDPGVIWITPKCHGFILLSASVITPSFLILQNIRCFDRNTVCLKDLPFLFIRQHKLWNDASLRIAIIINVKKLQFIHKLTASDTSKTAKITKKGDITHQHIA